MIGFPFNFQTPKPTFDDDFPQFTPAFLWKMMIFPSFPPVVPSFGVPNPGFPSPPLWPAWPLWRSLQWYRSPWSSATPFSRSVAWRISMEYLLVLNVGNGWEWGLLGWLLLVIVDHSLKFPTFSTSKTMAICFSHKMVLFAQWIDKMNEWKLPNGLLSHWSCKN